MGMILPPVVCWRWSAGQRSQAGSPSQSTAEISCREAGHYQACRQAGDEASPHHGDSRDRSTAEPIFRGQPCMCWFRPAFAIAQDCAATRAGDSAWAGRPGLPHRLADVLVQRRPQRGHARSFRVGRGARKA